MAKQLFNKLYFDVPKEVFFEVLDNRDSGFGYEIILKKEHLTPLQLEALEFLVKCYKKGLLGYVTLTFNTEAVGEVKEVERTVEEIKKVKGDFIISNSY